MIRCRLDQLATVTDPSQRAKLLDKVDEDYKRLTSLVSGESIALLRLQADILQAKGQAPDALRTLTRAVALMEHTPNKPPFSVRADLSTGDGSALPPSKTSWPRRVFWMY